MFLGMDVEQAQAHARQITVQAQRLSVIMGTLHPLVMAERHWSGEDAEAFRQRFLGSAAEPTQEAHDALLRLSRSLAVQCSEQDATSDTDAGPPSHLPTGSISADVSAELPRNELTGSDSDTDQDGIDQGDGGTEDDPQAGNPDAPVALTQEEVDQIYRDYQVEDDEMVTWELSGIQRELAEILGMEIPDPKEMTATEAEILDGMSPLEKKKFAEDTDRAMEEANSRYGDADGRDPHVPSGGSDFNDDHADAFRHAYSNALTSRTLGEDRATDFWTGHERIPGNQGTREAMDLYNNEVGRRIAAENPHASDEELADLVQKSIDGGEMVVIDAEGRLVPSNSVSPTETGAPPSDDPEMPGHPQDRQAS